jgi:hypothetical protein
MNKRPTISEIKRLTKENHPTFFDRSWMRICGQRLEDFSIVNNGDGRWVISAPIRSAEAPKGARTTAYFNPATNTLELT